MAGNGYRPGVPSDLRLSVLDQTPVSEGSTAAQALRNSIDLAQLAERLGYHRYWVAEHHGGGLVAGPSPEVLIGPIAAATERMRVGSGGVMLPHYSPLKVAESFGVLAGLFPGRIDLGIGARRRHRPDDHARAPARPLRTLCPTTSRTSSPSCSPTSNAAFPPATWPGWPRLCPESPRSPRPGCSAPPNRARSGPVSWACATRSPTSSTRVGRRSRTPTGAASSPARASANLQIAVAVRALVAETAEEAERLSASWRMAFDLLRRGRLVAVPPPEKAQRYLELHAEEREGAGAERRRLTGTPAQVRADIEEIAAAYGAEEVIVVTITHDHEARRRSYELLAEEFGQVPKAG